MLKIAMLSKWHVHAKDYAAQIAANPKAEIAAVWDEDAERGACWARKLETEFVPDLQTLLDRKDIAAVVCTTATTAHREVLCAAARAGKHIFTEKVLAATASDAEAVAAEVRASGKVFVISYPLRRSNVFCYAKQLVGSGLFGKIGTVRMRRSHSGLSDGWLPKHWFEPDKAGGGALLDLGAHPLYILPWLCGRPRRVSGILNSFYGTGMDENAAVLVEFENGAIGIGETSFVSYNTPDVLEIMGTDATLLVWGDEIKLSARKLSEIHHGYIVPNTAGLCVQPPSPMESFIDACLGLAPPPDDLGIDEAVLVSRLMEKAYSSDETGRTCTW